ncbi:hypothetical protein DTO169C6_2151 [Paecilomyces variotii]|nr:hypothetical protein DTO169C6_2151 [Paecilomyces variotii]
MSARVQDTRRVGVYTVMESSTLVGQSSRMTPGQVTGLELWDIGVHSLSKRSATAFWIALVALFVMKDVRSTGNLIEHFQRCAFTDTHALRICTVALYNLPVAKAQRPPTVQ